MMSRHSNEKSPVSTALVLSGLTLLISVAAFCLLYRNDDSFLAVLWLGVLLPAIWLIVGVLALINAVRSHSWKQFAGVVALLAPTAFLMHVSLSARFATHQLFSFQPLRFEIPSHGIVLVAKFAVCPEGKPCQAHGSNVESRTFHVRTMPDECCSLVVRNGSKGNVVNSVKIILNGSEVKLEGQRAIVHLKADNEIDVHLSGGPDAYVYVVIAYRGALS